MKNFKTVWNALLLAAAMLGLPGTILASDKEPTPFARNYYLTTNAVTLFTLPVVAVALQISHAGHKAGATKSIEKHSWKEYLSESLKDIWLAQTRENWAQPGRDLLNIFKPVPTKEILTPKEQFKALMSRVEYFRKLNPALSAAFAAAIGNLGWTLGRKIQHNKAVTAWKLKTKTATLISGNPTITPSPVVVPVVGATGHQLPAAPAPAPTAEAVIAAVVADPEIDTVQQQFDLWGYEDAAAAELARVRAEEAALQERTLREQAEAAELAQAAAAAKLLRETRATEILKLRTPLTQTQIEEEHASKAAVPVDPAQQAFQSRLEASRQEYKEQQEAKKLQEAAAAELARVRAEQTAQEAAAEAKRAHDAEAAALIAQLQREELQARQDRKAKARLDQERLTQQHAAASRAAAVVAAPAPAPSQAALTTHQTAKPSPAAPSPAQTTTPPPKQSDASEASGLTPSKKERAMTKHAEQEATRVTTEEEIRRAQEGNKMLGPDGKSIFRFTGIATGKKHGKTFKWIEMDQNAPLNPKDLTSAPVKTLFSELQPLATKAIGAVTGWFSRALFGDLDE